VSERRQLEHAGAFNVLSINELRRHAAQMTGGCVERGSFLGVAPVSARRQTGRRKPLRRRG
jgi:hypothetical protein